MKILNIIVIVAIVLMWVITGYYMEEVSSARMSYWNSFDYSYGGYNSYDYSYRDLTSTAGAIMLIFGLLYIGGFIANLVKIKMKATKVLSIIGLSLSLLFLLVNFVIMIEPGGLSFDESGFFFIVQGVIYLAFFIVFLVQSIKYVKGGNQKTDSRVLDIEIE